MNRNKDYWTFQEVFHLMLYGTDEEKQEVLTSMVHATNVVLDHLNETFKKNANLNKGEMNVQTC